jgi:riboflavin synthase alpha subunit
MTEQPNVQQLHTVEHLVAALAGIQDEIAELEARARTLRAQLVDQVGVGNSLDVNGVTVTVRGPSRTFDLDAAWNALTPEQQALAVERSAKKVKAFLPPVLTDTFMKPGTGAPIVTVK